MDLDRLIQEDLSKELDKGQYFVFNEKHVQALAFLRGVKNEYIQQLKMLIRIHGFKYNYNYDCYIKSKKDEFNQVEYRKEKDEFIHQIINWKLTNNTE